MEAVVSAKKSGACLRVRMQKPSGWKLESGQSIAVDGICSTVVSKGATFFDVDYMPETLAKTTADTFGAGRMVNLERSLTLGSFIDGSLALGHVDARGTVKKIDSEGETKKVTIDIPAELMRFVVPRGSIVVNGVSLTVVDTVENGFTVALIPYTLAHTNLGSLEAGDTVNIETDLFARYVARSIERLKGE
jgi:riboflavin synthase